MAENKKSVLLYCDLIHTVTELTDEEAGKLFKHYLKYINDLNPEPPDKLTQIVFEPIKQNLKRDLKKWEQTKGERSESGTIGNLKRWHPDLYSKVAANQINKEDAIAIANNRKTSHSDKERQNSSQNIANIAVKDTVTVKVTVKDKKSNSKDVALPLPDYQTCLDFWLKELHIGWDFKGQQGKALKSIMAKLGKAIKGEATIPDAFKFMCLNLPEWYKEKDLQVIDSKLNEILTEIKNKSNGTITNNGKPVSKYHN